MNCATETRLARLEHAAWMQAGDGPRVVFSTIALCELPSPLDDAALGYLSSTATVTPSRQRRVGILDGSSRCLTIEENAHVYQVA